MKTLLCLCLILLTPLSLTAENITLNLDEIKDGDYVLQIRGGKLVRSSPTRVVDLNNPTGPSPTPNPNPGPNVPFREGIKQLTRTALLQAGGTKESALALSAVYSLASERVPDANPDSIFDLVSTLSDMAVQSDKANWVTWRTEVSKTLAQLQRDGVLETKAEISAALKDISMGINDAVGLPNFNPNDLVGKDHKTLGLLDGILDPEKLEALIKFIELIMRLFELFQPKTALLPTP
jgi:hypothetical protein